MSTSLQSPSQSPTTIVGDSELRKINPKLVKVLKKLLQPKLILHNDDYLNLLFTHLTKYEDTTNPLTPCQLDDIKKLLLVWLKGAVMQFEKIKDAPNPIIIVFVLNVTKYLCACEQTFVQLNSEDIFERLIRIVKKVSQPNVTVALINLLTDFMDHKSGVQWLISTNHWELIIDVTLNNETVYVLKGGNRFVAKLLEKSITFNTTFCKNVILHILIPLDDATRNMSENLLVQNNNKWLTSTLHTLNDVLLILLKDCGKQNENAVILLFIENNLENRVRNLINLSNDAELKENLMKIMIFFYLYDLKSQFSGLNTIPIAKTDPSISALLNILYEAATKVSIACVMKLCYLTLNSWISIKAVMPICLNSNRKIVTFEDQILAMQLIPVITVFIKTIGIKVYVNDNDEESDFRLNFYSKFMDRVYSKTIRINYKWMQYLLDNFSFSNGISALKYLIHSKQFYNRENGILAFQLLVYLIEDLNCHLKKHPEKQVDFLKEDEFLALHLKVLDVIIDEFDVTWKDSVEALCLLCQMYGLLNGFIWPTKIVVNALKLAEKAISKYMTIQMALLIDDSESSMMNEIPPLIVGKLHDGAWEVRDSTVELIRQFAVAAKNTKFSSYKNLMLEHDFPATMVRMATSDGSSFVRASALKCLQDIIKDDAFWESIMSKCNIFVTIMQILRIETEGIVRSEAATLVDSIYESQNIPPEYVIDFYDYMSHAVVADLHWEVRVNALKFWKRVIDNRLTQQGMIDGSFPSVTFSKQLKKIVTLSPIEVRKRLVVVLSDLSEIGCLSVFYEALQDESDIEVSKFATEAVAHFVGLLKEYDVSVESFQTLSPGTPSTVPEKIDFPVISQSALEVELNSPVFSEAVMEEILDTRDLNLLESVFNTLDLPVMENIETKKRSVLCPIKFLNLVFGDLEKKLSEKTKVIQGIDNFQSLLDDILKEYEPTDVNSMDCY